MPVKELLESLKKDKEALLDAFRQLQFLSQRQREVVGKADVSCVDAFIKDKAESMAVIGRISGQIKKKVGQIRTEGAAGEKSSVEKFAVELDRECQAVIKKIVAIESSDRDFILNARNSLSLEIKDVDETKGKLKNIRKGYIALDCLNYFDKQG